METLEALFSPLRVKSMVLANRVVMPAMGTNLANRGGTASPETIAYLERRARGGAGLIITEVTAVHPGGILGPKQLAAYDDSFVPGLAAMASAVHAHGCRIALQLHHAGRESLYLLSKKSALGPSAVPSRVYGAAPREMTGDEIRDVIASFGLAAGRAREAGFDAVEIHAAHGYLLTQFLSALSNRRTDEYGGATLRERSRFVVEIIEQVRRDVGPDFPVSVRISTEESVRGGYGVEDMQAILPDLVAAGADIINASFGTHGSPGFISIPPAEYEPGFNTRLARKVKDVVQAPVIAVGRLTDPQQGERVIRRGEADLVAFGRQFLADPDFLLKAREGRRDDIRCCIACNQGCIEREMLGEGDIRCSINPETGQETVYPRAPAAAARSVLVAGAGPAGLTAAFEAQRLGHRVTLIEREDNTGGQVRYAAMPPHKDLHGRWVAWLAEQVRRAGVAVVTGTEVTEAVVREGGFDHVIVATGGESITPPIPGIESPFVSHAWQVLDGRVKTGGPVLIIGGGLVGMETADFLSERGIEVTIAEMLEQSPVLRVRAHGFMLHQRLREKGCRLMLGARVSSIGEGEAVIIKNGEPVVLSPVNHVVVATGMRPRDELKEVLERLAVPHRVVGDALGPRRIFEAVEEGARAAWEVQ